MTTQQTGQAAEQLASAHLIQEGLQLIDQNIRCRYGEIDLIMRDKDTLVFVEVRLRRHPDFGHAIETVTEPKQRRIAKTADYYLQKKGLLDKVNCRFDVIGIDAKQNIMWIKNAFEVQY